MRLGVRGLLVASTNVHPGLLNPSSGPPIKINQFIHPGLEGPGWNAPTSPRLQLGTPGTNRLGLLRGAPRGRERSGPIETKIGQGARDSFSQPREIDDKSHGDAVGLRRRHFPVHIRIRIPGETFLAFHGSHRLVCHGPSPNVSPDEALTKAEARQGFKGEMCDALTTRGCAICVFRHVHWPF